MVRSLPDDPWRSREERSPFLATILWAADRARPVVAASGVDFAAFRELLRLRVLLALRTRVGTGAWAATGIVLSLGATGMFGVFTGLTGIMNVDAGVWIVVSQSALAFLLALMLFQFVAGILVDPTDIGVVAPHPVAERTIFAVRLAEVAAHMGAFTASFTAGNVLLAVFAQPPLAVLFVYPLLSLLCAASTLGAVTLLFGVALRLVGPTHFQRVTLWIQILGGIALFAVFQVPRLVHRGQFGLWLDQLGDLRYLWPPCQYAALFAWASGAASDAPRVVLLAAPLVPVLALVATFVLASRYFVAGLQGTLGAPKPRASWGTGRMTRLGSYLTRPGPERAGFDFAAALSRREPHFLRGVLPQLAMLQFMSLAMGFGRHRDLALYLPMSAAFLFLVLPNVLTQAESTSTPEARDLFVRAPLASSAEVLRGGVKALLVQWIGAPALLLFFVQLFVAGPEALPRIVLALELVFVATLAFARSYALAPLFTRPIRVGETAAKNLGMVVVGMLAMAALGALHYLLTRHPLALAAGVVLSGALLVVLWRALDRRAGPSSAGSSTRLV